MNVTVAKKVGLFLSIILVHGFVFGMSLDSVKEKLTNLRSAIVRSDRNKLFVAATIPTVVVAGFLVAKYKDVISDYVSSAFENVGGKTVIGGVAAIGSGPIIYKGMQYAITPEMKLQVHNDWLEKEKETNVLLQQQKEIQAIIAQKDGKDRQVQLLALVNTYFAKEDSHKKHPLLKAIKACNTLELELQKGEELQKKINDSQPEATNQTKDTLPMFIQNFRGALIGLKQYQEAVNQAATAKANKLEKKKYTWSNQWASVISAVASFLQPMGSVLALWTQVRLQIGLN